VAKDVDLIGTEETTGIRSYEVVAGRAFSAEVRPLPVLVIGMKAVGPARLDLIGKEVRIGGLPIASRRVAAGDPVRPPLTSSVAPFSAQGAAICPSTS
jgi:hypothetical protein